MGLVGVITPLRDGERTVTIRFTSQEAWAKSIFSLRIIARPWLQAPETVIGNPASINSRGGAGESIDQKSREADDLSKGHDIGIAEQRVFVEVLREVYQR